MDNSLALKVLQLAQSKLSNYKKVAIMDKNDEIQQEKDIANGWRQKYLEAYERMLEAEAELAELKAKQTYASWGSKKRTNALDIG